MATACPLTVWHSQESGFPSGKRYPEDASETFNRGVPVFLDGDGMVNEVTTSFSGTETVLGISAEPGHNLTTQNTAETPNEHGSAYGMTSSAIPAVGSPVKDGMCQVIHAKDVVFRAALTDGQTGTVALVQPGTRYELAREANGYWSVDSTDTGTGNDHVVEIVGLDPNDSEYVLIRFTSSRVANV